MKWVALLLSLLLITATTAQASIPPMPVAQEMADQWADQPYRTPHIAICHVWWRHVGCKIDYKWVRQPLDVMLPDGRLVPTYGPAREYVRIEKHARRCVLTSDILLGRLARKC